MKPSFRKSFLIAMGPTFAVLVWTLFDLVPGDRKVTWMAGIAVWMAWWWLTEAVHFGLTSLLPLIALPALGIAGFKEVLLEYSDRILFVFAGGFVIALALERWNLHRRIALYLLCRFGNSPGGVLAGVLLSTYLISMWISNTATVMMLLPAVLAVAGEALPEGTPEAKGRTFYTALLLGLAYSATIGGMATLVGTPTNMIFYGKITEAFGPEPGVNFGSWMLFAVPLSLLLLGVCFLILYLLFIRKFGSTGIKSATFLSDLKALGPWSKQEIIVGITFLMVVVAWFTRSGIRTDWFTLNGWGDLFPAKSDLHFLNHDFLPATAGALFLLLFPSGKKGGLITVSELKRFPFAIILLFGGGFALAKGMELSGMSAWMATALSAFATWDPLWFLLLMTALICVISEFASNVACIQLMIPVLLAFHQSMGVTALYLLIPATLASSLGFMLPVATAPNTIVFSAKKFRATEMLKAGLLLDLAGIVLVTLFAWLLGQTIFSTP
ncbi:MAG: SLC13/DASS family transporter [Bacteroidia bacterium]|nr:SLC13/DASS family transporter [Bacteroidia bacterium]